MILFQYHCLKSPFRVITIGIEKMKILIYLPRGLAECTYRDLKFAYLIKNNNAGQISAKDVFYHKNIIIVNVRKHPMISLERKNKDCKSFFINMKSYNEERCCI